jgi:hypothetical protein
MKIPTGLCEHGNPVGHCRLCPEAKPFTATDVGAHIEEIHQPLPNAAPRGDYRIVFDIGAWRSHVITNVTYEQVMAVAKALSPDPKAELTVTFLRPNG